MTQDSSWYRDHNKPNEVQDIQQFVANYQSQVHNHGADPADPAQFQPTESIIQSPTSPESPPRHDVNQDNPDILLERFALITIRAF